MTKTTLDWGLHNRARLSVENYYAKHSGAGNINIPMYDLFVTEIRKDWEQAGYNLNDEADLFKLWGSLQVSLEAGAYIMQRELKEPEQVMGAVRTWGIYGNMTGLFLREMTKNCPLIPAIEEAASE